MTNLQRVIAPGSPRHADRVLFAAAALLRLAFSSMATKKKTFDAVAESRQWRVQTARKLRKLTFAQQQELLSRTTEAFFAAKSSRSARELAHR